MFSSCDLFLTGRCPYAESYLINCSENELIDRIALFKENNPEYKRVVYGGGSYEKIQDRVDSLTSLHYVFFNFKDIDKTITCIIGETDEIPAALGLCWVNGEQINDRKYITEQESEAIKRKFEEEILNHLGKWKRLTFWEEVKLSNGVKVPIE